MIKRGMERYSRTPEGALYTFQWQDEKGEWEQTWDPRNKTGRDLRMPEAVQVSLDFDMGNGRVFNQEFIVPIGTDLYSTLYNYGT